MKKALSFIALIFGVVSVYATNNILYIHSVDEVYESNSDKKIEADTDVEAKGLKLKINKVLSSIFANRIAMHIVGPAVFTIEDINITQVKKEDIAKIKQSDKSVLILNIESGEFYFDMPILKNDSKLIIKTKFAEFDVKSTNIAIKANENSLTFYLLGGQCELELPNKEKYTLDNMKVATISGTKESGYEIDIENISLFRARALDENMDIVKFVSDIVGFQSDGGNGAKSIKLVPVNHYLKK